MMTFFSSLPSFMILLWKKRLAILVLARRDFSAGSQGTYLGVFWAYLQPLNYIILLTLVFTFGLRSNPGGQYPFVLFLISGMIPWLMFTNALSGLTKVLSAHSYLIRRGDTPLGILPVAHLLSHLMTHGILLIALLLVTSLYRFPPNLFTFQLIYYLFAMCTLLLAMGLVSCSTTLFIPDVGQIVQMIIQFGFWMTPILWNIKSVSPRYQWVVNLNPMAYIIEGYRDSILYRIPFWEKWQQGLYFWIITLCFLFLGTLVFKKLKPHFGEVA